MMFNGRTAVRIDLELIAETIPKGARVLDLGCGSGELLAQLRDHHGTVGLGVEIETDRILDCIKQGVPVVQKDLDTGLGNFLDHSFDIVVMSQSLQQMKAPHSTLAEMLRIGREAIVTIPNFGFWNARRYLTFLGRMPMSKLLPYGWYDTPNIHMCTLRDFEDLCREQNVRIKQRTVVDSQHRSRKLINLMPNFLGEVAIYHIENNA